MRNLRIAAIIALAGCLLSGCAIISTITHPGRDPYGRVSARPDFIPTAALPWAVSRWADRTDQVGWVTTWGERSDDWAQSVVVDSAGNVYVAGKAGGPTDFNPGAGLEEINDPQQGNDFAFLSKFGPRGEYFWTRNLGLTFWGVPDMVIGKSGDVFMTGMLFDDPYYVARYSPDGKLIWQKTSVTNTDRDAVPHFAVDQSENVYLIGSLDRRQHFNPGGPSDEHGNPNEIDQGFITSFSAQGKYRWTQDWFLQVRNPMRDVAVDTEGNVLVLCQSKSEADINDTPEEVKSVPGSMDGRSFVIKMSPNGATLGVGPLDPTGNVFGERIVAADNGNFYVLGELYGYETSGTKSQFRTTVFVKELTFDGDRLFELKSNEVKTTGTCWSRAFDFAPNGDMAIAGVYKNNIEFSSGADKFSLSSDYQWNDYLMLMSPKGDVRWLRHWGQSPQERWNIVPPIGVAFGKDGIFVCGDFKGKVDFDSSDEDVIRQSTPGPPSVQPGAPQFHAGEGESGITASIANGPPTTASDGFLMKLSNSGNFFEGTKGVPAGPRIDAVTFTKPVAPNYTRRLLGKWEVTALLANRAFSIKEDTSVFQRLKVPASDIPPASSSCVGVEFVDFDSQNNRATFKITLRNPFANLLGYSGRAIILADDKYDLKSDEGYTSLWDETDKEVAFPMFGFPTTSLSDPYPWFDPGVDYTRELTFEVPAGTTVLPFTIAADMSAPGPPMDPAAITGLTAPQSWLPNGAEHWDVSVRIFDAQYDIPDVLVINQPFLSYNGVAMNSATKHEWYFSNDNGKPPGEYTITIRAISLDAPKLPMYQQIPIMVTGKNPPVPVACFKYYINAEHWSADRPVHFSASCTSTPNIAKYYWDWDTGETTEATNSWVDHQFTKAGTYNVSLIVQIGDVKSEPFKMPVVLSEE